MGLIENEHERREVKAFMHTGHGPDGINIRIEDAASRLTICTITLPYENMGQALHGSGHDCDVEIFLNPNIGRLRETESFEIWLPTHQYGQPQHKQWLDHCKIIIMNEHVKDGWTVDYSLLLNTNNIRRGRKPPDGATKEMGDWWSMHKRRYADTKPEEPNATRT